MKKKHSFKRLFCLILLPASLFCLAACSTILTGLPDEGERKSIVEGGKSLVIMRLSASLDGSPMPSALSSRDGGFRLEAAKMDTGEIPRSIIPVSPSQQAGKEGWVYFILEPGSYYLYVIPPGSFQSKSSIAAERPGAYYRWVKSEKNPIPAYWFQIPKGEPVIYLGSLSVSCKKGGLFGQLCEEPSEIRISDESEFVREVARSNFAISDTVWTEPLLDYGKPDTRRILGESDRLGIHVPGIHEIITPKWRTRALYNALGWGTPVLAFEGGYPPGGAAGCYLLFYVPPATLFGIIKGEIDTGNWEPCSRALMEELLKNDPSEILKRALIELLPKHGISHVADFTDIDNVSQDGLSKKGFNYLLEVRIMRIELKECRNGSLFSIDTSIRFLLKDTSSNKVLLDRTLLYADSFSNKAYELRLSGSSECRKMDEYCGDKGINNLKLALEKAFKSAVDDFFGN